ncbi:hypothetical protein NXX53_08560 [Bacteroides salyersiae]|nr:hypothetical protein [Bacteroides salyersiae]
MKAQIYSRVHYGFIAQELKNEYPNLVYENEQGDLSINYIEMIPLLVQSIQEPDGRDKPAEIEKPISSLKKCR